MERLIFPAVDYSDFMHPIVLKPKVSATIYTMNCPHMQMYRRNGYDNDYNRYDATMIDARHKEEMRDTQFPKDLERAYELGKRLVNAAK